MTARDPSTPVPVNYASYLRVPELLSLQQPLSDPQEHDETLFIVIHQVYELWFKQVLHELSYLSHALDRSDDAAAMHTFKRVLTILKTMVGQVDILETMTPVSFASFRSRLQSASGFQSLQFRKAETALGKRDARILDHWAHDPQGHDALQALASKPSLYDVFLRYLAKRGHAIPASVLERDYVQPCPQSEGVRAALLAIYRSHPTEASLCERMVDLDEGLQEWRYRHVKMVERTIGAKTGTGGSSGAGYLRSTLFEPLFPDLWAIRAEL